MGDDEMTTRWDLPKVGDRVRLRHSPYVTGEVMAVLLTGDTTGWLWVQDRSVNMPVSWRIEGSEKVTADVPEVLWVNVYPSLVSDFHHYSLEQALAEAGGERRGIARYRLEEVESP